MCLSVKGIARKYKSGAIALFSIKRTIFGGLPLSERASLRMQLESLARQEIMFPYSTGCIDSGTAAVQQTWSQIFVRIQLVPGGGVSEATLASLRTTWENGIRSTWSNRWAIGRSGESRCPLHFEVSWETGHPPHHVVNVLQGPGRANQRTWYTTDGGNVAAHE